MFLRWLGKAFGLLLVVAILGVALWTWGALKYVYSHGERAGYVQKISKRGWAFKTWEGELAMVNLPGAMPEKFQFSVPKEDVANRIEKSLGNRVVLVYEQHRFLPFPIFAETEYFVTDVRTVEDASAPQALPAQNSVPATPK